MSAKSKDEITMNKSLKIEKTIKDKMSPTKSDNSLGKNYSTSSSRILKTFKKFYTPTKSVSKNVLLFKNDVDIIVPIVPKSITIKQLQNFSPKMEKLQSKIQEKNVETKKICEKVDLKALTNLKEKPLVPIEEMFNIGITTFSDEDEVYVRKIPKYKEIKHYIKGEVLGRGKFGVVREFVDKNTLKRYAGKILTKRQIQRNHLGNQVAKELAVMFHLNHKNILRAYDLFQNDKKLYMFLELCWGELAEFIKHYKTLPKCQSKAYFIQIIEGLDYIHSKGIIHRDLKPENILLDNCHNIKLADFGCIQEIDFFAEDDRVSGNDGTPLYHPPELFDEKFLEYSGSKIDIWAAGGILYHMLTGEAAFVEGPGDPADVVIKRIKTANPNYDKPVIQNDILLMNLFQSIFEKDYTLRATIGEIKNNPWVKNRCASSTLSHYRPYPTTTNQKVDSYRSITVITRIHEKYNPSKVEKLYVDFKTFELSKQLRPLVRGTRTETKKAIRKGLSHSLI